MAYWNTVYKYEKKRTGIAVWSPHTTRRPRLTYLVCLFVCTNFTASYEMLNIRNADHTLIFLKRFRNRKIFGPNVYWLWSPFKKTIAGEVSWLHEPLLDGTLLTRRTHSMIDGYFTGHSLQLQRQHSQVRGDCQTTQSSYGGLSDNRVKLRGTVRQHSLVTVDCQTTQSSYRGLPDNTV